MLDEICESEWWRDCPRSSTWDVRRADSRFRCAGAGGEIANVRLPRCALAWGRDWLSLFREAKESRIHQMKSCYFSELASWGRGSRKSLRLPVTPFCFAMPTRQRRSEQQSPFQSHSSGRKRIDMPPQSSEVRRRQISIW